MDDQLKRLVKELGEAINQAVADSDRIAEVMGRIKASGHDVFLALEATIGFTQREPSYEGVPHDDRKSSGQLEITSQDRQFLRSLRIAITDKD